MSDFPVMDGANDDMSDGGTPKTEVSDLAEAGRIDEATPPGLTDQGDSLADEAEDPLG